MGRCSTTRSAWAMGYLYPISTPPLFRRIFLPLTISGAPVTVKSRRATPGSSLSHACRDAGPGARGASGPGVRRLPVIHGGALRNQFLHSNSCTLSIKITASRLSFSTNNCSSQPGSSNSATPDKPGGKELECQVHFGPVKLITSCWFRHPRHAN